LTKGLKILVDLGGAKFAKPVTIPSPATTLPATVIPVAEDAPLAITAAPTPMLDGEQNGVFDYAADGDLEISSILRRWLSTATSFSGMLIGPSFENDLSSTNERQVLRLR